MTTSALVDTTAELAVIDAVLRRNGLLDELADQLTPQHFGHEPHAAIYAAMLRLHAEGKPIDYVTLLAALRATGDLTSSLQIAVSSLGADVRDTRHVSHHARLVVERAALRNLKAAAKRMLAAVEDPGASSARVLEQAEQDIYELGATSVKTDWLSASDVARELRPMIARLMEDQQPVAGVSTGFPDLDQMTRGFQAADVILLGARPSQGKTAFGIQVALHAAQTVPVGVFSLEMSRTGIGLREVITLAGVNGFRMLSGRLSEVDQRKVGDGLVQLEERMIFLEESASLSPLQVRTKLRRLQARVGPIGLVVIDYIQLMASLPDDRRENKTNQVAGISRALKIMAREVGAPFLVLSQLHRVPDDRVPTMADLRDSGALEQDADLVLLLHRPEVYKPTPENAGLAELIVAKHRSGPVGKIELTWRPEPMRFESRARR